MYRSILVPVDGTAFGEHALALAATVARRTGAGLHLAHAHVPAIAPVGMDAVAAAGPWNDILKEQAREYLLKSLALFDELAVEGERSRCLVNLAGLEKKAGNIGLFYFKISLLFCFFFVGFQYPLLFVEMADCYRYIVFIAQVRAQALSRIYRPVLPTCAAESYTQMIKTTGKVIVHVNRHQFINIV